MAKKCGCNPPLPWWQRRDWTCRHGQVWYVERVNQRVGDDTVIAVATPTGKATKR
jgi:hypothetical protein